MGFAQMVGLGISLLFPERLKLKHILIANGAIVGITHALIPFVFYFRTASAAKAVGTFLAIDLDMLHLPVLLVAGWLALPLPCLEIGKPFCCLYYQFFQLLFA